MPSSRHHLPEQPPDIAVLSVRSEVATRGRGSFALTLKGGVPPRPVDPDRRFGVSERLHEGAVGSIFLAYDHDLGRQVQLHVLGVANPNWQQEFIERTRLLARLQHPNIRTVYALIEMDGLKCAVHPMRSDKSFGSLLSELRNRRAQDGPGWSLTRRMQLLLQAMSALAYAHSRGVAHANLTPWDIELGTRNEVFVSGWDDAFAGHGPNPAAASSRSNYRPPTAGSHRRELDDIYALGVILFELLTLQSASQLIHGDTAPNEVDEWSDDRLHQREVPRTLLDACQRAADPIPGHRYPSVEELIAQVQGWIEHDVERRDRRRRAAVRTEQGQAGIAAKDELRQRREDLANTLLDQRRRFEPWQPIEDKRDLFTTEDQLAALEVSLTEVASRIVTDLTAALEQDPDYEPARRLLAAHYWERFCDAEKASDAAAMELFGQLVRVHGDESYPRLLTGEGALSLSSDPDGVEVFVSCLTESSRMIKPGPERLLGLTPLQRVPLDMGSYLVTLRHAGYRDVIYPVHIGRNRHWQGAVRLYTDDQIGADFVYIPAGPFRLGGLENALPPGETEIDSVFVARQPLTIGEYLEFLNDLLERDPEAAARHAPRKSHGDTFLTRGPDRRFVLPEVDADGVRWTRRHPLLGIVPEDADAYCAWRSLRDGVPTTLPSEVQWEKAARGVDGRLYPTGSSLDPSLFNTVGSYPDGQRPAPVDDFPDDRSVYGVCGLGGNVSDITSTSWPGQGVRIARGGAFRFTATCAFHFPYSAAQRVDFVGFRLARRPPGTPGGSPSASGGRS